MGVELILKALKVGAIAIGSETVSAAIKRAYEALTGLIRSRIGGSERDTMVLAEHARQPDQWRSQMCEVLVRVDAENDREIASSVKTLMEALGRSGQAVAVNGDGNQTMVAGGDIFFEYKIAKAYVAERGPLAYQGMGDPDKAWRLALDGTVDVNHLRDMLLNDPEKREELKREPRMVSVKGLLYPGALLASGWWESRLREVKGLTWSNGLQEWLFHGFHQWGPSWDFTWDFERRAVDAGRSSFVAQLGDGDEANSIPIILPSDKARRLGERFRDRGHDLGFDVAGVEATITGVLCHRSQCSEANRLGLVGGILDFCIWLKEDEGQHGIKIHTGRPNLYSGYLWKCIAPQSQAIDEDALELNQVYFVWEHTNFANSESLKYNLDGLEQKERYIRQLHGGADLVLLQKSSVLVPGEPMWSKRDFYRFFEQTEDTF